MDVIILWIDVDYGILCVFLDFGYDNCIIFGGELFFYFGMIKFEYIGLEYLIVIVVELKVVD